ncbi:MAG: alcohol dehydrogenase [Roseovarius confluentis]|jgi:propanol-preferring alcohol dehydrogenase
MECQCVVKFGADMELMQRPDLEAAGDEIVLRITACGVCHSDVHMKAGGYDVGNGEIVDRGRPLPRILGHEIAGEVIGMGDSATGVSLGDKVVVYPWQGCGMCDTCKTGDEHLCTQPHFIGVQLEGGFASHIKVRHSRYLVDIGTRDPLYLAPLSCSGLTAFGAINKIRPQVAEETVVIIGAGGLGLMAIEILKALGARSPVVVDVDSAKREAAIAAGAGAAIDGAATDAVAQVQRACGGSVKCVIDFVGNPKTTELGFEALSKAGTLVLVGLYGGATPWRIPYITWKSARIVGSCVGSLTEFRDLMSMAMDDKLGRIPTRAHDLHDANTVITDLEKGKVIGRAVLTP